MMYRFYHDFSDICIMRYDGTLQNLQTFDIKETHDPISFSN